MSSLPYRRPHLSFAVKQTLGNIQCFSCKDQCEGGQSGCRARQHRAWLLPASYLQSYTAPMPVCVLTSMQPNTAKWNASISLELLSRPMTCLRSAQEALSTNVS